MKVQNLRKGQILKNYGELCEVLEVKRKTGNSKKAQMKELQRYVDLEKKGYKLIIKEKYNKPKRKIETRGGANNTVGYLENIEKLILDLLVKDGNKGTVFISKSQLLLALDMINRNYSSCKQRKTKLAKYMNIDQSNVDEWYESTNGMLERNINSALNRLEKQFLIFWSREITVCEIVPTDPDLNITKHTYLVNGEEVTSYKSNTTLTEKHREATEEEKTFILKTTKRIAKKYGCEGEQELIREGLYEDFMKEVKNILFDKFNISFYYKSYKIVCNDEYIHKKWAELEHLKLGYSEREKKLDLLNSSIIDRVDTNSRNRKKTAQRELKQIVGLPKGKTARRTSKNYLLDMHDLNKTLIKSNSRDIRKEVRDTEL